MYDMKRLAELVGQLEDQLTACMRCGMCQAVCPLYAETGREADVARGKLALLDGLVGQMFDDPKGVHERLMRCLLCGSCAANCPSGVKVMSIFLKARAILAGYLGMSPLKQAIFRRLLVRPAFFNILLEWGAKLQGVFVKPVDDLLGTSCARFMSPLTARHFKPLAVTPFHRMVQSLSTRPGSSGLRVGFFVGCLVDKIFPEVGQAILKSLRHHQVGIFLPADQGCCGMPALSSGDLETFNELVRHNLALFAAEEFDFLVTGCATCTSTIKQIWPLLARGLTAVELEQVHAIAAKAMDISQFLVNSLAIAPAQRGTGYEEKYVTYHDPCHLKKLLGVSRQPRALLLAGSAHGFKEMAEADRCCGCGGSFNIHYYAVSQAIGKRKRDSIVRSQCSVVATSCPACMMQISDLLSHAREPIQVKHVIEIYAASIGQ